VAVVGKRWTLWRWVWRGERRLGECGGGLRVIALRAEERTQCRFVWEHDVLDCGY
jgi:hypothetical protein